MKAQLRNIVLILLAAGLATSQARANDEAIAAIGGFLAGIITGVAIDDHHDHHHNGSVYISTGNSRYGSHHYSGSRCHKHGRYGCRSCSGHNSHRSGYWEIRHVKVWIPGHWEFVRNHCGEHVRIWKSGYYTTRPEKVWVTVRSGRHGYYYD